MKNKFRAILIIGFVICLCACTSPQQIEQTPTSTVKAETPTITPTPVYDAYVVNRARLFAAALTTNDQDLATRMIEYPLTVVSQTGSVQINNGEEFKKIYSALVNSDFLLSFGQPGKGNTVSSRLAGGLSLSEGDFAIVMNGSGMVKETHNLTVTKSGMESALVATETIPATGEECYKEASTVDEKLTCARLDLETSKNTLQALMIEIQPIVEDNQEYLQAFRIDYDQIGATLRVQSEWETYVQEQCDWEAGIGGNESENDLDNLLCQSRVYQQRINDLRIALCEDPFILGECEGAWFYKPGNNFPDDPKLSEAAYELFAQLPKLSSKEKVQYFITNRAKLFLLAIATKEKETAIQMISYPLWVNYNSSYTIIEDQQELLKIYDEIFDQGFVDNLLKKYAKKDPLFEDGFKYIDSSADYAIDLDLNGNVYEVYNKIAKTNNFYPTPTGVPTKTPDLNDCRDTAMGTYDVNMCFGSVYLERKQTTTNLVKNLGLSISAGQYQQLLLAEKVWELYSSDYCDWFVGFWLTGSIRGEMASTCLINQYDQRINNLRLFLCEDHGLSGECEASLRYKPKE